MKAVRLYAQVLVDVVVAPSSGVTLDRITTELNQFSAMTTENPIFLKVFDNPTLAEEDKQKALQELVKKTDVSAFTSRFLGLIIKRNRMSLLPDILHEVEVIQVEKKGGLVGKLVSAVPLDAAIVNGVADALSKKLNKPVQLNQQVDPGIIAGMRVTVAGVTYDGSAKGKLDKLTGSLR
ncbi:MAG: ATP synthase F1 subunit delta [Bdellovibrionales bacterium]|nr:ATP synthase F1 subunit delta [Bdellovibrionales bacterium]